MNGRRLNPATWPLTLKMPILVAVLIITIAAIASNIVLMRLTETQKTSLLGLTRAYLDGLSIAVMPNVIRKDIWETFDILDRARKRYTGLYARYTIVALKDGSVLASSDPLAFPVKSPVSADLAKLFPNGEELVIDYKTGKAWAYRALKEGNSLVGSIFAEIDISDLLQARHEILITLITLNSILTMVFVAIGYMAARRMVRPLALLSSYVERARQGEVNLIPDKRLPGRGTEFGDLFRRFNAMAKAMNERESLSTRLAEEEKLALIGKLATAMAHEVNNPLGGMGNAIDTIRKHGEDKDVRTTALNLLERGLAGIANVVRAALVTYKGGNDPGRMTHGDLEDLKFLIYHEAGIRRLQLDWNNALPHEIGIDETMTRQVVLNLLLNACAATRIGGRVTLNARVSDETVIIEVTDEGPGIPDDIAGQFTRPRIGDLSKHGGGLGVWTVGTLVKRMGGRIEVGGDTFRGSTLTVILPIEERREFHAVA